MKKQAVVSLLLGLLALLIYHPGMASTPSEPSGEIINGFRVLKVIEPEAPFQWRVFRGDYIKFDIGPGVTDPVLTIPALSVQEKLIPDLEQAPYVKMKEIGVFPLSIGSLAGALEVIEYNPVNYQAISAQEAVAMIESLDPLILDVRTPKEYATGHLKNSVLIPVQQLQARLEDLAGAKDRPILIYCATGNRSIVASKILIDKGFTQILNLKQGIVEWAKNRYPLVKGDD